MIRVRDSGGSSRLVTDIKFRDAGNALKEVSFIRVRDASNVSRVAWQRLSVSATSYVEGYGNSNSPIAITTSQPNPSVSGGTAPFTYSWSGTAGWTILYPTQLNTAFRKGAVGNGVSYNGTFTLTVTDANGNTAQAVVNAYVENLGGNA